MTEEDIRKCASECGIRPAEAAGACLGREILSAFAASHYSGVLISDSAYAGKYPGTGGSLSFLYREDARLRENDGLVPGQKLTDAMREKMLSDLAAMLTETGTDTAPTEDGIQVRAGGYVFPFRLVFTREEREIYPVTREIRLPSGDTAEVRVVPPEDAAAGDSIRILEQLELISSMQPYLELYYILKTETLEGRAVTEAAAGMPERKRIRDAQKNAELFKSYSTYAYMRRKWDSIRRRQGMDASWETVHRTICDFLLPIVSAAKDGVIFLDTWIPALGRYME